MPNNQHFIIIGAQRSGSTLLYTLLEQHPDISMSKPIKPEPKYFLKEKIDYNEYINQHFAHKNRNHLLGEKSTSYYEKKEAGAKIKRLIPNCKIIIILRDPVLRAISNYYFTKSFGIEHRSLEEVFLEKKAAPDYSPSISVNPFSYLERGYYSKHLKHYEDIFGLKAIRIVLLEKLLHTPSELKTTFQFLDVDTSYTGKIYQGLKKVNSNKNFSFIPPEVKTFLINHYRNYNRELLNNYNISLNYWL